MASITLPQDVVGGGGGGGGGGITSINGDTTAAQLIVGTTNRVTVGTVTGTTTIDISASYVGQSSITTLGTVTTGTWSATTIALNKGGTGATTKAAAFDALSPMTTSGDVIYGGTSGTGTRLAKGTDGQVLTLASGIPSWATPSSGGTPGGSNTQIQYNNSGAFGGDTGFTTDGAGHLSVITIDYSGVIKLNGSSGSTGQVLTSQGASDPIWSTPAGGGDVIGPGSSTTNAIARYADASGTLLDNSDILIDTANSGIVKIHPSDGTGLTITTLTGNALTMPDILISPTIAGANSTGGNISLVAGTATGGGNTPGDITLTAGLCTANGDATGGDIFLNGGSVVGGNSSSGSIICTFPAKSGSGIPGSFQIITQTPADGSSKVCLSISGDVDSSTQGSLDISFIGSGDLVGQMAAIQCVIDSANPSAALAFKAYPTGGPLTEYFRISGNGAIAFGGPTNYGSTGEVLISQGATIPIWGPVPAAGSDTQVMFNNSGALGGDAGFVYNKTTDTLGINNIVSISSASMTIGIPVQAGNANTLLIYGGDSQAGSSIAGNVTIKAGDSGGGGGTGGDLNLTAGTSTTPGKVNITGALKWNSASGTPTLTSGVFSLVTPAADNTYSLPTSITIVGGIITAIS